MNIDNDICYDFPVYSENVNNEDIESNPYTKYTNLVNFYKQLYLKTPDYRCTRDMIKFMIHVTYFIYIYNGEELLDSDIMFDRSRGMYLSNFKFIYDSMPKVISGYRNPGYDSIDKRIDDNFINKPLYNVDENIKITEKIDDSLKNLLIDIFKSFCCYSYQEILPYIQDMNIHKKNTSVCNYVQNNSGTLFYRIQLVYYIKREDIKDYFNDSNNLIDNFICNYDFSTIKAQNKLNSINENSKLKVKSYIDSAKI